jgi:hypothetical protein
MIRITIFIKLHRQILTVTTKKRRWKLFHERRLSDK